MSKKHLVIVLAFILCSAMQANSQTRLGVQAGYGTEIETLFFGFHGEFFLNEKVSLAPGFSFYLPQKVDIGGNEVKSKYWELNGDVHYYFSKSGTASFYGLGGLNYLHAKTTYSDILNLPDESDGEIGINLGIGLNIEKGNTIPFFELKYETTAEGQFVILGGIRFLIQ
jgi:hypothetical protein